MTSWCTEAYHIYLALVTKVIWACALLQYENILGLQFLRDTFCPIVLITHSNSSQTNARKHEQETFLFISHNFLDLQAGYHCISTRNMDIAIVHFVVSYLNY